MLMQHGRKIRACEQLQNFFKREQVSNHLIFASKSSKGQMLRALLNWIGPFDTPHFPSVNGFPLSSMTEIKDFATLAKDSWVLFASS